MRRLPREPGPHPESYRPLSVRHIRRAVETIGTTDPHVYAVSVCTGCNTVGAATVNASLDTPSFQPLHRGSAPESHVQEPVRLMRNESRLTSRLPCPPRAGPQARRTTSRP